MKNQTKKRIAVLVTAIMLVVSICIASVFSASGAEKRDRYGLKDRMETAMQNFEDALSSGKVYANIADAYTAYVNVCKLYDQYYLGNNTSGYGNETTITSVITKLENATSGLTEWTPQTVTGTNMNDSDHMWYGSDGKDSMTWGETSNGNGPIKNEFKNLLWLEKNYNVNVFGRGDSAPGKQTIFELTYPIQVVVYDGIQTPCFAVLAGARGMDSESGVFGNNRHHRFWYGTVVTNANLSITRNWSSGINQFEVGDYTRDFTWNYYSGDGSGRKLAISSSANTGTSLHYNSENVNAGNRQGLVYAATMVNYDHPTDSGAYVEYVTPSFTFYAGSEENPNNNGAAWNNDITGSITGKRYFYVINYKALIDAVNGTGVTDSIKNIKNYREGGLSALLTAVQKAQNYNYNGKIVKSNSVSVDTNHAASGENALVASLDEEVSAIGSEIKAEVDGINHAAVTADGYDSLRKAIKDTLATYDLYNTGDPELPENPYCNDPWKAFKTAFEAAQSTIMTAGQTGQYTNSIGAAEQARTLNETYAALTLHKLSDAALQAKADHNYDDKYGMFEIDTLVKASCTQDGHFDWHWLCENCSESVETETNIVVPKIEHSGANIKTYDAVSGSFCNQKDHPAYYQCTASLGREYDSRFYDEPCRKYFENADGSGTQYDSEEEILNAIGTDGTIHAYTEIKEPATCTTPGKQHCWQCAICQKYFTSNKPGADEIPADEVETETDPNAHTFPLVKHDAVLESSCRDPGVMEYYTCSACNKEYYDSSAQQPVANHNDLITETSHILERIGEQPSTCVDQGHNAYYHCSRCNLYFKDPAGKEETTVTEQTRALDPKNHKSALITVPYAAPKDCKTNGTRGYKYCEDCHRYYSLSDNDLSDPKNDPSSFAIKASHTIDPVKDKTPFKNKTCTAPGNREYYTCSVCGQKFKDAAGTQVADDSYITIPASHGTFTTLDAVSATCTTKGYNVCYQCNDCKKYFATNDGSTVTGDKHDSREDFAIPVDTSPRGHHDEKGISTLIKQNKLDETCTTDGQIEHYKCQRCGKRYTNADATKEITDGSWKIPRKHILTHVAGKDATCLEDGREECWQCTREHGGCGKYYSTADPQTTERGFDAPKTITRTGHNFGELKPEERPNCERGGKRAYKQCQNCKHDFAPEDNDKYSTTYIETALNEPKDFTRHTHLEKVPAHDKSCTRDGNLAYSYCDGCGCYYAENADTNVESDLKDNTTFILKAEGHNGPRKTITVEAATCYAEGKEYDANVCETCGTEYDKSEVRNVPKIPHPDGTKVTRTKKAATCRETGIVYDAKVCVICGQEYDISPDRETPKLAHIPGSAKRVVLQEASCTSKGAYYDEYICRMCHEVYDRSATMESAMLPHTQGKVEKKVIKEATCTEKGSMENKLYCAVCGRNYNTYTTDIALKQHTPGEPVISDYVAPTETRNGSYVKTVSCTVCGKVLSQKKVSIPKTGSGPDSGTGGSDEVKLEIIDKATDKTYVKYSGTGADIQCTGPLAKFVGVTIDGRLVAESDYDVFEGSTLVSFHSDYLDGLKVGKREVVLIYSYGSITTNLTIIDPNGGSGDDNPNKNPSGKPSDKYSENNDGTVTYPGEDGKFGTDDDITVYPGPDGKPGTDDDRVVDKGKDGIYGTDDDHYTDPEDGKNVYPGLDGKFGTADDRKDQGNGTNSDLKGDDRRTNGKDGIPGTADDKALNGGDSTSPETGMKIALPAFISVAFVGAYILYGSRKKKNEED